MTNLAKPNRTFLDNLCDAVIEVLEQRLIERCEINQADSAGVRYFVTGEVLKGLDEAILRREMEHVFRRPVELDHARELRRYYFLRGMTEAGYIRNADVARMANTSEKQVQRVRNGHFKGVAVDVQIRIINAFVKLNMHMHHELDSVLDTPRGNVLCQ